jgi:hypothetical protein
MKTKFFFVLFIVTLPLLPRSQRKESTPANPEAPEEIVIRHRRTTCRVRAQNRRTLTLVRRSIRHRPEPELNINGAEQNAGAECI